MKDFLKLNSFDEKWPCYHSLLEIWPEYKALSTEEILVYMLASTEDPWSRFHMTFATYFRFKNEIGLK